MNSRAAKRIAGLAILATLGVAAFSVATVASAKSVKSTQAISESIVARSNGGERGRPDLSKVAALLGMTSDELKTQLQSGKSLAAVAESKNIAVSSVISAIIADIKTHLDAEVLSGEHTQAEANAKLLLENLVRLFAHHGCHVMDQIAKIIGWAHSNSLFLFRCR